MRTRLALAAVVIGGVVQVCDAPAATKSLWRTDAQAQTFLEHSFKRWAGLNLAKAEFKFALCVNGYYSKVERHTGEHYPQGRTNRYGEDLFRSFSCSLSVDGRSFNLYLVTRARAPFWRIRADR